jgi:hypothetical protein
MKSRLSFILFGLVLMAGTTPDLATAQIAVSLPNLSAVVGQSLQIPIGDLTGKDVIAYEFTVTYNSSVLSITSIVTSGTISASFLSNAGNTGTPGQIIVGGYGFLPVSGSGVFMKLNGTVVGIGTSPLTFSAFKFNEGSPSATRTDGLLTVAGGNHRPVFTAVSTQTAKDGDTLKVTLSATDLDNDPLSYGFVSVAPASTSLPTVTGNLLKWTPAFADVGRTYAIRVNVTDNITNRGGDAPGVDSLTVNVTVNRSRVRGDVDGNGSIQAADAAAVLKHVVSLVILTNPAALWAADVTGGGISTASASMILRAAVGLDTIPNQ